MAKLPDDIVALIEGQKSLGIRPQWDETSDPRYSFFIAPLTVGEIATGGFELRILVAKRWPDRDAMLQLEYAPAGRRSATELCRVDWRRFHTHVNRAVPESHAFQTYTGSHVHGFFDNYMAAENRMRAGSLPAATPLNAEPNTLSELLAFCGDLFRIKDIGLIRLPTVSADLFWAEDD